MEGRAEERGAPSDPPVEPEPPTERRLLVSDLTCEKLGVLLQDNPLGLLLVRDELAAWIGAFDRLCGWRKGQRCSRLAIFLRRGARGHRPQDRCGYDLCETDIDVFTYAK